MKTIQYRPNEISKDMKYVYISTMICLLGIFTFNTAIAATVTSMLQSANATPNGTGNIFTTDNFIN